MSQMTVSWNFFKQSDFGAGGELAKAYGHNYREKGQAENALASMMDENVILIDSGNMTYEDAIKKRYMDLRNAGTQNRKVRDDANVGIEFVFNYSDDLDAGLNKKEWSAKVKNFIVDKFGKENVTHMILHMDEPVKDPDTGEILYSGAHIHAFVVPVDREKGVISNAPYLREWQQQSQFHQTFYDEVAKDYGCERPKQYSARQQQALGKFYTSIGNTEIQTEISMNRIKDNLKQKDNETEVEWAKRIRDNVDSYLADEINMLQLTALKEKENAEIKSMESANKAFVKSKAAQDEVKQYQKLLKRYDLSENTFEQVCNYARFMKYTLEGLKEMPPEQAKPLQDSLQQISTEVKQRRDQERAREKDREQIK